MYGNWLVARDQFKDLLDFSDKSVDEFLKYIHGEDFLPCIFIGRKEHWIEALEYSFKGEIGYTLWGSADKSSSSGIYNRYQLTYLKYDENKNKIIPNSDKILVAVLRVTGEEMLSGIIGFGIVTDINIDATRNFKGWQESDRYWITRFRIKLFWLHKSIRENPNNPDLWEGEKENKLSAQSNICYKEDKIEIRKIIKDFILNKNKDEIKLTLDFYVNLMNSIQQNTIQELRRTASQAQAQVMCNSGEGTQIDVSDIYFEGDVNIILTSLRMTNVLLVGPPGTGKTSLALKIVRSLTGNNDDCYEVLTANSLWFRRNLIGGESIKEGTVVWRSGLLIQAYVKAARVSQGNYYVIIDEINRADVDKAFGELITIFSSNDPESWFIPKGLIDEIRSYGNNTDDIAKEFLRIYDELKKQGKENEPLKKIRIIATMNLVDARNLFYVGEALARRFLIFRFDYPKGVEDLEKLFGKYNVSEDERKKIKELVGYLREKFRNEKNNTRFNISTASLKSALDIYSSLEKRDLELFIDILRSTLGTLNQENIIKFDKIVEEYKEKVKTKEQKT